jgi:sugar lactone lactonase YvrE
VGFGLSKVPESYGEPKGRLWRYDPDGTLHQMASGLVCGNGVKWSPDNKISTFWILSGLLRFADHYECM